MPQKPVSPAPGPRAFRRPITARATRRRTGTTIRSAALTPDRALPSHAIAEESQ